MKKVITIFAYCLFLVLLAEFGVGYIGYRLTQGHFYSYNEGYEKLKQERRYIADFAVAERIAANMDQAQQKQGNNQKYMSEILHPYLGYVVDFHDNECPKIGFCDDRMRGYKNLLQGKDFPEAGPNRTIVVITGGSVAYGIANNSSKGKLEQALSTLPGLEDKEILIYTLALGGYKQPQQLFAIQYYLSMGAHFDMIINIDGFNDMVLPLTENISLGTNPFFPRAWQYRIRRGLAAQREKGLKAYTKEQRALLASRMNKNLFRRSSLCNLIWKLRDAALTKRMAQVESEYLHKMKDQSRISSELITAGTKFPLDDEQLILERIARFWRRSSELLHNVAKAENIKYYHFLQPNQYVKNSKPMNEEERKKAFLEGSPNTHPYANDARRGYPYLIAQGAVLEKSEVAFHDLTMMFKDNHEVVYYDACCHFNTRGYDYIIDEIINFIKENERQEPLTTR